MYKTTLMIHWCTTWSIFFFLKNIKLQKTLIKIEEVSITYQYFYFAIFRVISYAYMLQNFEIFGGCSYVILFSPVSSDEFWSNKNALKARDFIERLWLLRLIRPCSSYVVAFQCFFCQDCWFYKIGTQ